MHGRFHPVQPEIPAVAVNLVPLTLYDELAASSVVPANTDAEIKA